MIRFDNSKGLESVESFSSSFFKYFLIFNVERFLRIFINILKILESDQIEKKKYKYIKG